MVVRRPSDNVPTKLVRMVKVVLEPIVRRPFLPGCAVQKHNQKAGRPFHQRHFGPIWAYFSPIGAHQEDCTPQGTKYFGWEDASEDSPADLADKLLERFLEVCKLGLQADKEYVKWFSRMLTEIGPEGLPSICAASPERSRERDRLVVIGNSKIDSIKLPPPPITGN